MDLIDKTDDIADGNAGAQLLQDYLEIQTSTTAFLEEKAKQNVEVHVQDQFFEVEKLTRRSILYLTKMSRPILYAECLFEFSSLEKKQKDALIQQKRTIGDIFGRKNLRKIASHYNIQDVPNYEKILNVPGPFYLRSFDLYYKQQKIAELLEVVNEQSLCRIYQKTDVPRRSYA